MPDINPLVNATKYLKVKQDDVPVRLSYPRASSIATSCMRLHVLAMKHQLYRVSKQTDLASRMAFSLGNALHYWIQNQPDFYGDSRRGWWRCLACEKVPYFGKPPASSYRCPFCGAGFRAFEYMEHPMLLKGKPFYGSGHPDLFLVEGQRLDAWNMTNELKSIKNGQNDKWDWDNIVEPLADHKYQVVFYLMGLGHDPILDRHKIKIVPDQANISYIAKGNFGKKLPIKTFTVERRFCQDIEEHIAEKLLEFKLGLLGYPRKLPSPLAICRQSDFHHYNARSCPGKTVCQDMFMKGYK